MSTGRTGRRDWEATAWLGPVIRLRRWSRLLAAASGVLLAIVGGCQLLISSSLISLTRIDVTSDGRLERGEILSWAKVSPGESLLLLRLGEIRSRIESHPWVERAWVRRRLPHTLEITVEEKRPVARIMVDKDLFLMDRKASIFPPMHHSLEGAITLVGLKEADLWRRPEACQRVLQEAVELLFLLADRPQWKVKEVGVDPDRGLRLALEGGPWDIRIGFGDLNQRLERLEKILEHLGREGRYERTQWIDLRYPEKATVRFKG